MDRALKPTFDPSGARPAAPDHRIAIRDAVANVRARNALGVAWLRVALRTLTLVLYLYEWGPGHKAMVYRAPFFIGAGHLAAALLVLVLLHRRWKVSAVAFAAAALDVAVVALAGLRATDGTRELADVGRSVGYLMGVMQLMLLFAAVSLPARLAAVLAVVGVAHQAVLSARGGMALDFGILSVFTIAGFSFVAVWAGLRMVELAAKQAVEATAAELSARHAETAATTRAELEARHDAVLAAQERAEALVQLVVHDLKNPLSAVLQYLEMARGTVAGRPDLADLAEDLAIAECEGRRLSAMIGDLLVLSKLEAGAVQPARDPVPVGALLASVARSHEARAREAGATVVVRSDPDLVARLDLDLVRRLVENLLTNALRHAGGGGTVELAAEEDRGGSVRLAVRNDGPPVPPEMRERLFEKGATDGRERTNAGLGLYLCRLVAEVHGGRMALAERPGWRVSFEATLPQTQPKAA